jgi:hypothetical protein
MNMPLSGIGTEAHESSCRSIYCALVALSSRPAHGPQRFVFMVVAGAQTVGKQSSSPRFSLIRQVSTTNAELEARVA